MEGLISIGFCGGLQPVRSRALRYIRRHRSGWALRPALLPVEFAAVQNWKTAFGRSRSIHSRRKGRAGEAGADAVEMEAAAVAKRARQWRSFRFTPCAWSRTLAKKAFRWISIECGPPTADFSRAKILAAALRRPGTVFPELIKLNKRTKRAAQALGDFLADARF